MSGSPQGCMLGPLSNIDKNRRPPSPQLVSFQFWWFDDRRVIDCYINLSGCRDGNLADLAKAGSLHEFLMELHETFGPIASFWMGQKLTVSIASPKLFKEHSHVFDRPRKSLKLSVCLHKIITTKKTLIFLMSNTAINSGSRISKGVPTHKGHQPTIWPIFPKHCRKMKEFWSGGGGGHAFLAPLELPLAMLREHFFFRFFADDLYMLIEPLITMDSIQYANGADGRKRRKIYDQSFSHQAITEYYETFQRVCCNS